MTVGDLIHALQECPPGEQIALATDPEGNGGLFHVEFWRDEYGVSLWPGELYE